jgi:LPS export ABC transporter protein LptC
MIGVQPARGLALVALAALLGASPASSASETDSVLEVTGMTFVRSRDSASELVVRARHALFWPDSDVAKLEDVQAVVTDEDSGRRFEMSCDRAELDVETNDIKAEGDVQGVTSDGRRYSAPWVRYEHEAGVLYSDAPVVMVDDTGTFRGDGFRFLVQEGHFRLLGNVSVVHSP